MTDCALSLAIVAAVAPTVTSVAALILALRTHFQVTTVKKIINGHDRDG